MTTRPKKKQQSTTTDDDDDNDNDEPQPPPIRHHHRSQQQSQQQQQQQHVPWIGGPGTLLPFYVEAFLAWMLAIGCLGVSGYHYIVDGTFNTSHLLRTSRTALDNNNLVSRLCHGRLRQYLLSYFFCFGQKQPRTTMANTNKATKSSQSSSSSSSSSIHQQHQQQQQLLPWPCWLPLTTYSRSEMDRATPSKRMQQLRQILIILQKKQHHRHHHNNNNNKLLEQPSSSRIKIGGTAGVLSTTTPSSSSFASATTITTTIETTEEECWYNDQQLITLIRGNVMLRRLASLAMRPQPRRQRENDDNNVDDVIGSSTTLLRLRHQLTRIWPDLLRLPPEEEEEKGVDDDDVTSASASASYYYPFEISLIMACFRERPSDVQSKLHHAYSMASRTHAASGKMIQVVLVDAGGNNNSDDGDDEGPSLLHQLACDCSCQWANNIKIIDFSQQQQGRGPALNAGAANADGRILAFLHSDTRLPVDWDVKLLEMFPPHHHDDTPDDDNNDGNHASGDASNSDEGDGGFSSRHRVRANAAAFGFGIDMSGLNKNNNNRINDEASSRTELDAAAAGFDDSSSSYYPPGLRAVQVTANLRCRLWSLPYGDQCLCVPAIVFNHVGGYPHQCFMEDYELIALLRRRKALMHKFFHRQQGDDDDDDIVLDKRRRMLQEEEEALKIIPGPPALCSPRRWQRFGVLYVTFMNSRLVNLYHARPGGLTPEDLYERYYGHALEGCQDLAPWETQLLRDLQQHKSKRHKGKQMR